MLIDCFIHAAFEIGWERSNMTCILSIHLDHMVEHYQATISDRKDLHLSSWLRFQGGGKRDDNPFLRQSTRFHAQLVDAARVRSQTFTQ
jgi:hypothetical protein